MRAWQYAAVLLIGRGGSMSKAFENARAFFEACETPLGWDGCAAYVADGAGFSAQSEPLVETTTVAAYCDWMHAFGTITAKGAHYTLHSSSWDEATRSAHFFATYHATHVGEGGPVPATQRTTHSHYVYVLQMDGDDKVAHMTKIWNAGWAARELGWS